MNDDTMSAPLYAVGDWVAGLGHREKFGPGQIISIARLGASTPFYRIQFPEFQLHLEADEVRPAPAPS